jgi:hypothetical protein
MDLPLTHIGSLAAVLMIAGTIHQKEFSRPRVTLHFRFHVLESHYCRRCCVWVRWHTMSERTRLHGAGPLLENYHQQVAGKGRRSCEHVRYRRIRRYRFTSESSKETDGYRGLSSGHVGSMDQRRIRTCYEILVAGNFGRHRTEDVSFQ